MQVHGTRRDTWAGKASSMLEFHVRFGRKNKTFWWGTKIIPWKLVVQDLDRHRHRPTKILKIFLFQVTVFMKFCKWFPWDCGNDHSWKLFTLYAILILILILSFGTPSCEQVLKLKICYNVICKLSANAMWIRDKRLKRTHFATQRCEKLQTLRPQLDMLMEHSNAGNKKKQKKHTNKTTHPHHITDSHPPSTPEKVYRISTSVPKDKRIPAILL